MLLPSQHFGGQRRTPGESSISRSNYRLFLIDQSARHWTRCIAEKKYRQASNVVWTEKATERHPRGRFIQPSITVIERHRLHVPLRRRVSPAQVYSVDANPIESVGVGRVLS